MIKLLQSTIQDLTSNCLQELENDKYLNFQSAEQVTALNVNRQYGIVYFIYIKENNRKTLVYVGKARGKYFKTRLRSHLFGKSEQTQSKNHRIKKYRRSQVLIKFLEFQPDALRNLVEELLIEYFKKEGLAGWNYK